MPTPYLTGNNVPCAACELRREVQDTAKINRDHIPCNVCGGVGLLPLSAAEIVRCTVEEARRNYCRAENSKGPDEVRRTARIDRVPE